MYKSTGNYVAAEPCFQQAMEIRQQALGEQHPAYITTLKDLTEFYQVQGRLGEAELLLWKVLSIYERRYEPDDLQTATILTELQRCLQEEGKHEAALPISRRALFIYEQLLEPSHPDIVTSLNNLGLSLVCLGGNDNLLEAEQHLLRAVQIEETPCPHYWLAKLYQSRGTPADKTREQLAWQNYLDLGAPNQDRKEEAVARLHALRGE
jgi:tetratricopeptide (TPR) repeat protein